MPEIEIVVSGPASSGTYVDVANWGASSFDHAALVTAHRSRADAKDFYLRHTTYGAIPIVSVSGANTTACCVTFNLASAIVLDDYGYRIGFGDLGKTFQTTTSAGSASTASVSATTVPSLSLPAPSLPIVETVGYAVREYSTGLQRRAATLNEHTPQHLTLEWRNASGERAHEIRAYVESTKGAGTVTLNGYEYTVTPGSLTWEQRSALAFDVSLELDLVQL